MTKSLLIGLRAALFTAFASSGLALVAQTITVSGSVVDASTSEPIIGANIIVAGTNIGTVTDYDGQFQLQAEQGATLEISYIGYVPQGIAATLEPLEIELAEDAAELEQVVVVGYGSQRKSDLTGAISSVSEEEIKALPVTGLDQALQGRAAGVYVTQNSGAPGGGVSVRIRGIGSIQNAEPLYVVDGIPIINENVVGGSGISGTVTQSNPLNSINPNDIESIEILKDASATAIYGSRGANGVVLIRTKRGRAGTSSFNYETYYSLTEVANRIDVLDLREYAEYLTDLDPARSPQEFDFVELLGEGTDWQDAIFQRGATQNHQLTVTGGSDRTQFSLGGGVNFQEGTIIGSDFSRYSGRFSLDHDLAPRIKLGASLILSRTDERIAFTDNNLGVLNTALRTPPSAAVFNADGSYAGPDPSLNINFINPVANALENQTTNEKTRAISNLSLEAELTPWLTYRTELGTDIAFTNARTFTAGVEFDRAIQRSSLSVTRNSNNFWINKHLLTFSETFAEEHRLTALAGFEAQSGSYEYLGTSRNDLPNNRQQEINLGDAGTAQNFGGRGDNALVSWFGRANYSWREKYLLTATGRIDGSSNFGPENRYGFFPSFSFAWRVSEEGFLSGVDVIDNLKLRLGYGAVGNQNIPANQFLPRVNSVNGTIGGVPGTGFLPQNIANPRIKWEASEQANVGIDVGFVDNRIAVTADAYVKRSTDMLLRAVLPGTVGGFESPFVNVGQIDNYGFELAVNTVNTTGAFGWNSSLNFTVNRNEVVSLGTTGEIFGFIQFGSLPVTRTIEGEPIGQFYGWVYDGIFQDAGEIDAHAEQTPDRSGTLPGDVRFRDLPTVDTDDDGIPDAGDGVIDGNDRTFIGNPLPDFTANFSNTLTYRGFELTAFLQGVFGNDIYNTLGREITFLFNTQNQRAEDAVNRFTLDNPSDEFPRATGMADNDNNRLSSRYVEDGTFVRLRTLNLAYQLPTAVAEKLKLSNGRVYVSGQNLVTFTKYSGYDPEVGSFNQDPLLNGIDNGRYPASRSVTVGLSANF